MSRIYIPVRLRRLVVERAAGRCEYCLLHEDDTPFTHPIDRIVATRHGGQTLAENLALACINCNRNKSSDLTTIDPLTGLITRLFNPRTQVWQQHFALEKARIVGLTDVGRATVVLLRLNDPLRLLEREILMSVGRYPPANF